MGVLPRGDRKQNIKGRHGATTPTDSPSCRQIAWFQSGGKQTGDAGGGTILNRRHERIFTERKIQMPVNKVGHNPASQQGLPVYDHGVILR